MKSKVSFCMQYKKPEVATGSVLKKKMFLKIAVIKFAWWNLQSKTLKNSYEEIHSW